MLFDHDKIKRTVTNLPNGIRTMTESSDPQVARKLLRKSKITLQAWSNA